MRLFFLRFSSHRFLVGFGYLFGWVLWGEFCSMLPISSVVLFGSCPRICVVGVCCFLVGVICSWVGVLPYGRSVVCMFFPVSSMYVRSHGQMIALRIGRAYARSGLLTMSRRLECPWLQTESVLTWWSLHIWRFSFMKKISNECRQLNFVSQHIFFIIIMLKA